MTETVPGADRRGEFPYGVGRAETADGPIAYTTYDASCALAVLQRSQDREEPEEIVTLTDEQVLGVDGHRRTQPAALPWAGEHDGDREVLAAAGIRSLMAAELVVIGEDQDTGERRWLVDPAINGCTVLRRTAPLIASAERQVRAEAGMQTHRLYYYVHPEGVLEEEVTASGMHVFRSMRPEAVPARMVLLVDQDEVAEESTEAEVVVDGDLREGGRFAERLADARAITVVSSLNAVTDAVKQLILYASTSEVLAQQTDGLEGEDPEVSLKAVSRDELLELAAWFIQPEGD